MRIISGRYKGRLIKMPKGIRPTQDKVRKALFDILGNIQGLSFLELFAGSGAVGIEAFSRGVKEVVFVEKDRRCVDIIRNNSGVIGLLSYRVIEMDTSLAIKKINGQGTKFDIVFLDPPYFVADGQSLAKKTLQTLGHYDILTPNGFVVVQHFKKENLPETLGDLTLFKQAGYGDTILSFYKKNSL